MPLRILRPEFRLSGCVLYLKLDEGSGSVVKDESGYNNHGTIYGANWTDGKFGKGLRFDGVDDYVKVNDSASLDVTEFTLESWIKVNTVAPKWQGIVTKKDPSVNSGYHYGYQLHYNDLYGQISNGSKFVWIEAYDVIEVGKWLHVVFTFKRPDAKVYVNGNLVAYEVHDFDQVTNDLPWTIGVDGGYGNNFNGTIDEVHIYNRALSEAEIIAHFRGARLPMVR